MWCSPTSPTASSCSGRTSTSMSPPTTPTSRELVWGDDPDAELLQHPLPDFVLGSDVIYNEEAVDDLLVALNQLSAQDNTPQYW
uniref:Uncharacterized protein n=1 Tax=Arundo donax TaxID=35708 RepID=A0A0A9HFS4_ARUDO